MARVWILCAALLGASGVTLGAYHAHGLEGKLKKSGLSESEVVKRMDNCRTAVQYQMYHVTGLLAVGLLAVWQSSKLLNTTGVLFLLGVAGFSGGLYLMVFTGNMVHWAIVPSGGLMLICAWLSLGVSVCLIRNWKCTAPSSK